MGNVNQRGFRMDVQDHAMHDADERVVQSEVSGEGDNARDGHALAKYSLRRPESSTSPTKCPCAVPSPLKAGARSDN